MPDMKMRLFLLVGLLIQPVCYASDIDTVMLQINPFLRPALEAVLPDSEKTTADTEPGDNMQLRGTMLAGSNSLVEIAMPGPKPVDPCLNCVPINTLFADVKLGLPLVVHQRRHTRRT